MTIHPDIRDQAYQFFLEEAPELLQIIEAGILSLRQTRDTATVHSIMRAAHSLKGGSASVGLDAIKAIAHRLETIFKAFYSDSLNIDTALERQLLQAFDCLRVPLIEQLTSGRFDAELALHTAEPVLAQLEEHCQEAIAATENFIPSSSDLGINMAVSIFEVDVEQGIELLKSVLAHPQNYEVAGELRAQSEVFFGFSELLNLPGFGRIAQTVLKALETNPHRALEILEISLSDFQLGRTAVLVGDLTEGGTPSNALLALAEQSTEDLTLLKTDINQATSLRAMMAEAENNLLQQIGTRSDDLEILVELGLIDSFADHFSIDTGNENINPSIYQSSEAVADSDEKVNLYSESLNFESLNFESLDFEFIHPISTSENADNNLIDNSNDTSVDSKNFESVSSINSFIQDTFDLEARKTGNDLISDFNTAQIEKVFGGLSEYDNLTRDGQAESSIETSLELLNISDLTDQEAEQRMTSLQKNSAVSTEDNLVKKHDLEVESNTEIKIDINPKTSLTSQALATGLTVRVDAERLSRMNNLLGELIINRNGLVLQNDQLRSALRELLQRFERFQTTVQQLRSASDQMLVPAERREVSSRAIASDRVTLVNPSVVQQAEFDALEMDSYTTLYSYTQTLLEETVQLEEAVEDITLFNRQSNQMLGQHRKMLSQMQDELMWARMLPLSTILNRFPRVLRDLSNTYQKPVNLALSGTDLLIDKAVLEKLYDPLLHLLRNSFDHGIETVETRQIHGKPEEGQIEIQAVSKGRQVIIQVRDDGQGLNPQRIQSRLVELGWFSTAEVTQISSDQLCEFIFEPGFSTASQVSELSGRGIGLNVVREQMRSLKGNLTVTSTPMQGTTFILSLPLTLTITNLLICFVGSTPLALRSDSITEVLIPKAAQMTSTDSLRLLKWRDQDVPVYRLSDLLTYACVVPETPPSRVLAAVPSPTNWETPMLILKREQQVFALQVDRLVTEQEFVIKPFGCAIAAPSYAYGCTVLGDGSLVPVIDGAVFLEVMVSRSQTTQSNSAESNSAESDFAKTKAPIAAMLPERMGRPVPPSIQNSQMTTVLVIDDAVTSRRMVAMSLERAGYRVLQARDGQEGLEQLQQSQSIQLVVCDVEMPNMNGFEFLTQRRQNPEFAKIATVMLTSRSNEKHRWLALQLGATAYFTKPYVEQEFLRAIASFL